MPVSLTLILKAITGTYSDICFHLFHFHNKLITGSYLVNKAKEMIILDGM